MWHSYVNLFNTVFIIKISILAKLCVWDRNHWKEWHLWNFTFCCGREDLSIPYIHTIYSSNCIKILFHIKTGKMIFWVKELHHLAIRQSVKRKELALPIIVQFHLWDAFISCPQWPIQLLWLARQRPKAELVFCVRNMSFILRVPQFSSLTWNRVTVHQKSTTNGQLNSMANA